MWCYYLCHLKRISKVGALQTDGHTDRSTDNMTTSSVDQDEQEMFQKCDLCYTVQIRDTVNTLRPTYSHCYHDGVGTSAIVYDYKISFIISI